MGAAVSRRRTSVPLTEGTDGEKISRKYEIKVERVYGTRNNAYGHPKAETSEWIASRFKQGKFILPLQDERLVNIKDFEKKRLLKTKEDDPDHTYLAQYSINKKYYSVAVRAKSKIAQEHLREEIVREISLTAKLSNTFISNVFCVTQCTRAIYIISDFCVGGNLEMLLRRHKRLPDDAIKFYCAEIAAAIVYLHERHIIAHRNIRASTVFIGEHGHIKLAGFERCIALKTEEDTIFTGERDYGSDWYTPPELMPPHMVHKILKSNPGKVKPYHTLSSDWWMYACLCYFIFTRKSPFGNLKGGDETEYLLMSSKILTEKYIEVPKHPRDALYLNMLLENVFKIDQSARWGWEEVEDCRWYETTDFTELKNVKPPFLPYTKVVGSSRHFRKCKHEPENLEPVITGEDIGHTDIADVIIDVCYSFSKPKPVSDLLRRRRDQMGIYIDPKLMKRFDHARKVEQMREWAEEEEEQLSRFRDKNMVRPKVSIPSSRDRRRLEADKPACRMVPETPILDKLLDVRKRLDEVKVNVPSKVLMSIGIDSSEKSEMDDVEGKFKFRYKPSTHPPKVVWRD